MSSTLLLVTLTLLVILISCINLYSITNAAKATKITPKLIKSDEGYEKGVSVK